VTKRNELSGEEREMQPNIGIIGAGAIGGFYGAMLVQAGFEVHFLPRSDYEHVAKNGLTVRSRINGNLRLPNVDAHQSTAAMPKCDWLLIGTKATSNVNLAPTIIQTAATGAKVIVLQNGLGIEDKLRPLLPDHPHLIGGLCYVCLQRTAPGVIDHIGAGLVRFSYHSGLARNLGATCNNAIRGCPLRGRRDRRGSSAGSHGGTLGQAHLEYPFRMPLCFARRRHRQVDRESRKPTTHHRTHVRSYRGRA
jgi:hypothetical protein